jgi:GDPmannose 4,6-dehydratase
MLQQDEPDDYVIAMGQTYSVRDFVELAFSYAGLNWKDYVVIDEKFFRPAEVFELRGNASKARKKLGWTPDYCFEDLVQAMMHDDLKTVQESHKISRG